MQNCHTEAAQILVNLEILDKRVAMAEDVLLHVGLREVRDELSEINEKIVTIQGQWEAATAKLQGCDSEIANA